MKLVKFAAITGALILAALLPASALAGAAPTASGSSGYAKMTRNAPPRLSAAKADNSTFNDASDQASAASAQPPSGAAAGQPSAYAFGVLPYTGLNLLPETVAGVLLVGIGVALRARRV